MGEAFFNAAGQSERFRGTIDGFDPGGHDFATIQALVAPRKADRLKLLCWDGTGLVMAYERLEDLCFTWPAMKDGLMLMNHA